MLTGTIADETLLEGSILDLLVTRREIYPSHIVGKSRRRDRGLPVERMREVLKRLFVEGLVALLWRRYLLARDVGAVRAKWLAMIDRQAARIDADPADPSASQDARNIVSRWDGWRVEGADVVA